MDFPFLFMWFLCMRGRNISCILPTLQCLLGGKKEIPLPLYLCSLTRGRHQLLCERSASTAAFAQAHFACSSCGSDLRSFSSHSLWRWQLLALDLSSLQPGRWGRCTGVSSCHGSILTRYKDAPLRSHVAQTAGPRQHMCCCTSLPPSSSLLPKPDREYGAAPPFHLLTSSPAPGCVTGKGEHSAEAHGCQHPVPPAWRPVWWNHPHRPKAGPGLF